MYTLYWSATVPDYTLSTDLDTEMLKESKEGQPGQHEDPRMRTHKQF